VNDRVGLELNAPTMRSKRRNCIPNRASWYQTGGSQALILPSTRLVPRTTDYATVLLRLPEISNDLEVVRLLYVLYSRVWAVQRNPISLAVGVG
jgi:hypothetical protein